MGTSNWQNISYNIDLIRKINPKSVLDIGVGFGRWGILCREFLEIWDEGNYSGKWKRKIDGIEVFQSYIKEYHKHFYDNMYIHEAFDFIKNLKTNYDLIICGDVIEHFEKSRGKEFISLCFEKSTYLMINIPLGNGWEQSKKNNNIYEEHLSIWYLKDFKEFKPQIIRVFRDFLYRKFAVVLISNKFENIEYNIKKRYGKYYKIKAFANNYLNIRKIVNNYDEKKKHSNK